MKRATSLFEYDRLARRLEDEEQRRSRRKFLQAMQRARHEQLMTARVISPPESEAEWEHLGRGLRSAPSLGVVTPTRQTDEPSLPPSEIPWTELGEPIPRPDIEMAPGYWLKWDPQLGQYIQGAKPPQAHHPTPAPVPHEIPWTELGDPYPRPDIQMAPGYWVTWDPIIGKYVPKPKVQVEPPKHSFMEVDDQPDLPQGVQFKPHEGFSPDQRKEVLAAFTKLYHASPQFNYLMRLVEGALSAKSAQKLGQPLDVYSFFRSVLPVDPEGFFWAKGKKYT